MSSDIRLPPAVQRALDIYAQWVHWVLETKIPQQVGSNKRAASDRPSTWSTFDDARKRRNGHGLGFVLTESDPFCVIDLDNCIDSDGLHPSADKIVKALDSYTEISPSGKGLHIWTRAKLVGRRHLSNETAWGGKFEVYDRLRYFTVTGQHLAGSPKAIRSRQQQVEQVVAKQLAGKTKRTKPKAAAEVEVGERYPVIRSLMCGLFYRGVETDEIIEHARAFNESLAEPVPPEQWDRLVDFVEEWLPAQTEAAEQEFWGATDILSHVRKHAQANLAAPWAVLGCTLARVAAATPFHVVLPGRGAGANKGSLNFFCALVGEPGTGKDQALSESQEAIDVGDEHVHVLRPGSGEGISHAFKKKGKDGEEWVRRTVLFQESEIETLDIIGKRQGSTLFSELRNAWSGGVLGHAFVDPQKRLNVKAHSYRLALVVGVQPTKAGAILSDVGGGFPQRIVWCTVADPYAAVDDLAAVGLLSVQPSFQNVKEQLMLPVCSAAQAEINAHARIKLMRPQLVDPLRGHWLFTKLKTAALLAILHGCTEVDDQWWGLAEAVMQKSDESRALCSYYSWKESETTLEKRAREARKLGKATALGASEAIETREADLRGACERVVTRVCASGQWTKKGRISQAMTGSSMREQLDTVLTMLVNQGRLDYRRIKLDGPGRPSDEYRWIKIS